MTDRYALIEISLGPVPEGTTWDTTWLDEVSTAISDLVMTWKYPETVDPGVSSMIRRMRTGTELGYDDNPPSTETIYTSIGHYVSTYCLHDHHDECRNTCKSCDAPCKCNCHRSRP